MATEVLPEIQSPLVKPLAGRVALVTGSSRGIGRAIALDLSNRGAIVAVHCRCGINCAEEVRDHIVAAGGECQIFQGNVADKVDARTIVGKVLDEYRHLDILINNAGITRDKSIRKMTDDEWTEVIDTNLNGVFYCTSAALPSMIDQKFGRIVNIASFVGQTGNFGQANYAASKGGVIAFTKVLALELARYNITANVVAPGFTLTEMLETIPAEIMEQIKAKIPLHRLADPEEIAKAVGFLVCDGSSITGQQLNVNGGIYI